MIIDSYLSERCTSDGVGESVVLAEVLVLQGHVPVVHGDGQLPLAHQPLEAEINKYSKEKVRNLYLVGNKVT